LARRRPRDSELALRAEGLEAFPLTPLVQRLRFSVDPGQRGVYRSDVASLSLDLFAQTFSAAGAGEEPEAGKLPFLRPQLPHRLDYLVKDEAWHVLGGPPGSWFVDHAG